MEKIILEVAKKAALKAGENLLKKINESHELVWGDKEFQGYKEIKSQADLESNKVILDIIWEHFPQHAILSEESGYEEAKESSPFTWIIDPLHDTVAYVRGNKPECSVTIAVAKGKEVICSVLYQPFVDKLYYASVGKGAYLNKSKISVSQVDSFKEANLSIQHNAFKYGDYEKLIPTIKEVKRMYALGSAMFPELAEGVVDIVVS